MGNDFFHFLYSIIPRTKVVVMQDFLNFFAAPGNSLESVMTWVFGSIAVTSCLSSLLVPFSKRAGGLTAYSKFAKGINFGIDVPSRVGMVLLYAPSAFLAAAFPLNMLPAQVSSHVALTPRTNVVSWMVCAHFVKRCLECMFLHKYSGTMPLATSGFIQFFYLVTSMCCCAATNPEPLPESQLQAGAALFAVGLLGNLYHHYLLATLRKPGEKAYKVPQGGLFSFVAAPHYLFELIGWLGIHVCGGHQAGLASFSCMVIYLADRANGQHEWNIKKLDDYPSARKRLIPFLY